MKKQRRKLRMVSSKLLAVLQARGLDFARAGEVFASVTVPIEDTRRDYRET